MTSFVPHSRLSISIPLSTMYGYDITSLDDPVIVVADKSIKLGTELLVPGSTFINIFPILGRVPTWFPGAKAVRIAAEVKKLTAEMKRIPMEFAKTMMVSEYFFKSHSMYNNHAFINTVGKRNGTTFSRCRFS